MGGGCGPTAKAELSQDVAQLAATTVNCSGTDYGLFGGGQTAGFQDTRFNTVDIYSCETEGFLPQ